MTRPLLAITMGDPAGVGPEVIAGAWSSPVVHALCRPVVAGHPDVMRRAAALVAPALEVCEVDAPEAAEASPERLPCVRTVAEEASKVPPRVIDARGGQAAYDALVTAADWALEGRIDGLTTAPLHKAALHRAGHAYPGHTELLAERCGVRDFAMMLYLGHGDGIAGSAGLGVAHVTLHLALRDVFANLSSAAIASKTQLLDAMMRRIQGAAPRLAVCALNPHGGEEGLFGDEEQRIIAPAVEQCRAEGLNVVGPLPTDTLMVAASAGQYDGVVAMYHDQGHIALKLLGMHRAVNVTLGLPVVRTSVAHGTAFDLAWQGRAETSSMVEALRIAALLANARPEKAVDTRG
ncbi:MAG: 4-hydroxythreonine-4-phosphate dehydrogenase PdxA [Pirellulales bacterium]|nr:4-hydroxythreonine-4-phosphate dehydrogenase PdxA [Pirellulales bacterium]